MVAESVFMLLDPVAFMSGDPLQEGPSLLAATHSIYHLKLPPKHTVLGPPIERLTQLLTLMWNLYIVP